MPFAVHGHELAYDVRGEGRPLFLFHGLTVDRHLLIEACEPVLAARPGWQRVYVDLPGHGASGGDAARASADYLVDSLGALVRDVAAGRTPYVLGHSYGAYLALGLVRDLPGLGGAFLACPIVEPDFGRRRLPAQRIVEEDEGLDFADDLERETFWGESVRHTRAVLERFRRVVHPAHLAADRAVIAATRRQYVMSALVMGALQQFAGPVGIVCGRDDHWAGFEDAVPLVRAFADCRYEVAPGAGHLLPLEDPPRFQAALAEWLARAEARAGGPAAR